MKRAPLLAAAGLLLAALSAQASEYVRLISLRLAHVYEKNGRQRVVMDVVNHSSEILDIDILCEFLGKDNLKLGTGRGSVLRLPAHRSDTLEVVDEIAQEADSARCEVADARK